MEDLLSEPTSAADLFNIAKKRCNVFQYDDLKDFDEMDDLYYEGNSEITNEYPNKDLPFDDNAIILLYKSEPNFGHWTMVTRNGHGYHYLDSYGEPVDKPLDYIEEDFKEESGQDIPYLANLLLDTGRDVYYNSEHLQELNPDISTCGRYCAIFLKYSDMDIDKFSDKIKKMSEKYDISNDELISLLTTL